MAVVLGTSSGFVTVAPTADPTGTGVTIDGNKAVTKHTSPSNVVRIIEIGWYRASGTNAANWEVGLYADSAGTAGARLFVDDTNSTTSNGWVTVAVDWAISSSTAYWLGLQMDAHSGSSSVDGEISGGAGIDILAGTTLDDPFGGGAVSDADGMYAIYALVELGATDHTATPSDSLALADSASPAKTIPSAQADTTSLSDTGTAAWTQDRSTASAVALGDSLSRVHLAARTPADAVALTDQATPAKTIPVAVNDSVALADEATPELGVGGTDHTVDPADTLAVTDTLALGQGKAVTDTLALDDAATTAEDFARAVADSIALTDGAALSRGLAHADTLGVADTFSRATETSRTVSDAVAITDEATSAEDFTRAVDDTLALDDAADPQITTGGVVHELPIDDTIALADAVALGRGLGRADALSLADEINRALTYARVATDTLALADEFNRIAVYQRTPTEQMVLADLLARAVTAERSFADAVTLADLAAAQTHDVVLPGSPTHVEVGSGRRRVSTTGGMRGANVTTGRTKVTT